MADRTKTSVPANRPVPMKLFATWEVDRTPSNCIPRLCTLTLTRLVILRPLGADLASISIAVKMQSSKRTLRSNEMIVPSGGILDTELELQFALQYPHFLKRDGNKLLVLLQRRKRYKNRTMLGYKTLAEGIINMAQVLQKQMDLELELVSDKAEKYGGHSLARVNVVALSSQPVDQDKRLMNDPGERLCQEFSDEEEEFSSEGEAEGSDSEPTLEVHRRKNRTKIPGNARQRNLKQKFIALLKRFRVSEELEHDQEEIGQKLSGGDMEIEELFDELEDLSGSDPELDTMSISSTPKPSLRPFFSSSRSLLAPPQSVVNIEEPGNNVLMPLSQPLSGQSKERSRIGYTTSERGVDRQSDDSSRRADSDSHPENWTDHEANDPPNHALAGSPPKLLNDHQQGNKEKNEVGDRKSRLFTRDRGGPGSNKAKKHSLSVDLNLKPLLNDLNNSEPRKLLVEQLSRVLPDDTLPDSIALVSLSDPGGAILAANLQDRNIRVLTAASPADVRATFTCLIARIQKFCNSSAKPPTPIKVVTAGGDGFVNTVLRHYVDLLSFKSPDWQSYLRFFVVPLGSNSLAWYLASVDARYSLLFCDEWRELLEREGACAGECAARVAEYLASSAWTLLLPIAEAMVTYRETDDSSQIFVPFVNDVRVGCYESSASASVDLDEGGATTSSSPPSLPASGSLPMGPTSGRLTPPSSPNVGQPREGWEPVELQLDYWGKSTTSEKVKCSLRQAFKILHVQRLSPSGEPPGQNLSIFYMTKEKKQKIMRLGKKKEKEKENEPKCQQVDGVTRLICSAKTQNIPLRVSIDGTEWYGVKFFQLSSQWQTHIKTFPVAMLAFNSQQQSPSLT
ncbi:PREDICTED: phosphofurin acidic cluster sorting protein 2 [Ceratosolen solmsi marchali]|uniref:Phosphofurin acidic cluster sorting protein 2 n=1 Tax=Ceratosolen solmsi marchali TaxID=326594 RepID=A0AAJ6YSW3_9HYME|nr:PREDICTED: phosphofurin acidic cluster sorting protein 2 [Ceratosolen solmsi marchali]